MSFGWSAGDIASAVALIYNIIEALDSVNGAGSDYREAVGFLQALKRTLDPLQAYTSWHAYPNYGKEIEVQVVQIKGPMEKFLKEVMMFEPSLGAKARKGYHRYVLRKLQWYVFISKKVLELKKKIESHMRIVDTLLQRLTLEIVYTSQQQLPDQVRSVFEETLKLNLVGFLRDNLVTINTSLLERNNNAQNAMHDVTVSRLSTQFDKLSIEVQNIRAQLDRPTPTETQVRSKEFLGEIYYLVFLYLGRFLQNIFLTLSQAVGPRSLITPTATGVISLERLLAAQTRFDLTNILCDDFIILIFRLMMDPYLQRYGRNRSEVKKNVFFPVHGSQILIDQHLIQDSVNTSYIPKSDQLVWEPLEGCDEALLSLASLGIEVCSGHNPDNQELLEKLGLPSGWQFRKAATRRMSLSIKRNGPGYGYSFSDFLLNSWISLAHPLLQYMGGFKGKKLPIALTAQSPVISSRETRITLLPY